MSNFNKVILMGNLTRDPEMRSTGSGMTVANFTLAMNDKDYVSFVDCAAFDKTAELIREHLVKGSSVLVEGRLHQQRWEQNGTKRSKIEVYVNQITFVGSRKSGKGREDEGRPQEQPEYAGAGVYPESDIPF